MATGPTRRQDALGPHASSATFDWPAALLKQCDQLRLDLAEEEELENAIGMLEFHSPISSALIERAGRREFTAPGLDDAAIATLEARLGTRLPRSYRAFLQTTDGLFAGGHLSLLPAADVEWFVTLEPETVAIWEQDKEETTDEQYATYGPEQDCIHMRTRHLRSALQVSTSIDGDVLLLVPDVRFGDEWEAWFFGAKNPGAYRYRSFAEMVEDTLFRWTTDA